jgi:hypothetical protein
LGSSVEPATPELLHSGASGAFPTARMTEMRSQRRRRRQKQI